MGQTSTVDTFPLSVTQGYDYRDRMAPKKKLSIALNAETAEAIAESAELHGESVSA